MLHELKICPNEFKAVKEGLKSWEFRFNDRDFHVGDTLRLREWLPAKSNYSGDYIDVLVTYILHGGPYSIPETHCIMSIKLLNEPLNMIDEEFAAMVQTTPHCLNCAYCDDSDLPNFFCNKTNDLLESDSKPCLNWRRSKRL